VKAQEAVVARARAQIEEIKARLQYTTIRSAMDGIVVDKHAEPGDLATPGRALLTLQSPLELRMEAPVSESCARRIRTGHPVRVKFDALDVLLDAHVTEIVPAIDPGSRSFLVRADLPRREDLQPGMFGRLRFPCGTRKILSVPSQAAVARGQLDLAFVVREGKARMRLVRIGEQSAGKTEVLSGLAAGEVVVVDPPATLRDGDPVRESAQPREKRP
jgi:RND family efflux transporter MFP subunit